MTQQDKPKLIIAGGTGFLGKALANYFKAQYDVVILSRSNYENREGIRYVQWDGRSLSYWALELDGAHAVINLTGRSVDCRYNEFNKNEIYRSRLESTYILGQAIAQCKSKPKVWLNAASATIYRHAMDRPMTEADGELGTGFSVDVCRKWEKEFYDNAVDGVRQVAMRIAIVLGYKGSVMTPLTRLVKYGMGGKMGTGRQIFSWIHETDFCRAVEYLLNNTNASGSYNLAAPGPVSNETLMQLLRKELGIPFGINQPKWMLELGAFLINTETELILKSRWVLPGRLLDEGFVFTHAEIGEALHELIHQEKI